MIGYKKTLMGTQRLTSISSKYYSLAFFRKKSFMIDSWNKIVHNVYLNIKRIAIRLRLVPRRQKCVFFFPK